MILEIQKPDVEAQTTLTLAPNEDAVFVTLLELKQIKEDKDALDCLAQESMETVDILKQKVIRVMSIFVSMLITALTV